MLSGERTICLSSQYPGPVPRCETWSGQLRRPLFGLAPDGVFRASALALGAVGSYSTFSPLPFEISDLKSGIPTSAVCSLWHCPSGRLSASPPACIPKYPLPCVGGSGLRGIAPFGVRTFLPRAASGETEAVLRPSKINLNILGSDWMASRALLVPRCSNVFQGGELETLRARWCSG